MGHFVLKYVIKEGHQNQEELEWSEAQRRLVSATDAAALSGDVNASGKRTGVCWTPVRRLI